MGSKKSRSSVRSAPRAEPPFLAALHQAAQGPAPGSLEGLVYTRLSLPMHLFGLPEVLAQATLFSVLLVVWHRRPHRAWAIVLGTLTGLTILLSVAGVLLGPQA